jgi:hypothetical protein
MAKACAATSDKSYIRAPFAGRRELRDDLGPLRSLAVEDVHTVDGGGGFGAGGDAELARMLDTWTLAVLGEMDGSLDHAVHIVEIGSGKRRFSAVRDRT